MAHAIGIDITDRIAVGLVEGEALVGNLRVSPEDSSISDSLQGVPAENIVQRIVGLVQDLKVAETPMCIGVGMPGIVRNGIVEDSPNLIQFKGTNMRTLVADALASIWRDIPVAVFNDADVMAAGLAAVRGHLDRVIRVWTLGTGIGFGRYPAQEGVWEAGHTVVSLDPKEQFCGCGGKGHLEGIMGQRAMRLRFMDMEPEEVFAEAERGDQRCIDFVKRWHRALAAATATSIHLDGPGKFFVTGANARFLNLNMLNDVLQEMVKLSPLQGYSVEIVASGEAVATIGAAVNASQLVGRN